MSDEELQLVDQWLAFAQCAVTHPVIPRGVHAFDAKLKLVPEVQELYGPIHQLYSKVDDSKEFREPVNALEVGIYQYYQSITTPMSLREVLTKIHTAQYSNAEQVMADVRLVWQNCETFNGLDHPLTKQARKCEVWLQWKLEELENQKEAPVEGVQQFRQYAEDKGDDELLNCVYELVQRDAPSLIVEGELELQGMKNGLLRSLQQLIEDHAAGKALVIGKKRNRATPTPSNKGGRYA